MIENLNINLTNIVYMYIRVLPVIMEENEYDTHSQDEVDSVKIKTERLPMMLTEETVGHQAPMEPPVKMGRRRKNCIVASKHTVEKEKGVPIKKMGVGLAPTPNLKAREAKIVSQSSPCHSPGRSKVKIRNKKVDYSKIKAKVDTWWKI
jgi:hypothetical protein